MPVFLLFLPLGLFSGLVTVTFLFLVIAVMAPLFVVGGWRDRRRFLRNLRKANRIADWPTAVARLSDGSATLLVEIGPKGAGAAWLIDRPRDALDPGRVAPTWNDFRERAWEIVDTDRDWSAGITRAHAETARFVPVTVADLDALDAATRGEAVLFATTWSDTCLSRRVSAASRGAR